MRTWKQGAIGRLPLRDASAVYTKCLKYPLLRVYDRYDAEKGELMDEILMAFVDLEVLKKIEKIGMGEVSKDDKHLGLLFSNEYANGTSAVERISIEKTKDGRSIEEVMKKGIVKLDELYEAIESIFLDRSASVGG